MTKNELIEQYEKAVIEGGITHDEAQVVALKILQHTFDELKAPKKSAWFGLLRSSPIKGVYLYGPVGRGKTFLMDLFYQQLPRKDKVRMHFYQFMKMVHENLKQFQGRKDPLKLVAKRLAKKAKIICFDEFFVENIVDAMLLGGLLRSLYDEGITMIATSNVKPDGLYKDGLQRDQFLPAIDLLEENNHIVSVDNRQDYRLLMFDYDRAYYYPQDPEMRDMLFGRFKQLAEGDVKFSADLMINDRDVLAAYLSDNIVWFDFKTICGAPRSQLDYLVISQMFDTVFLGDLRAIGRRENDLVVNFISLVDVFYDAKVKLIISSSVPIDEIYQQGLHAFEFERTESRLIEMQSKDYLSR